jgi:hypothetical protein
MNTLRRESRGMGPPMTFLTSLQARGSPGSTFCESNQDRMVRISGLELLAELGRLVLDTSAPCPEK